MMNLSVNHFQQPRFGIWSDAQRQAIDNVRQGGIADLELALSESPQQLMTSREFREKIEERMCRQIDSFTERKQVEDTIALLENPDKTTFTYTHTLGARYNYREETRTTQYRPANIVLEAIARAFRRLNKKMT